MVVHETEKARVARVSEWGAWRLCDLVREGYGRRVERVLVRQKLQAAHGGASKVFSGPSWLGFVRVVCSVTQCLCFDSWMSRTMRSESYWDCGRDGGDSLLTVTTG